MLGQEGVRYILRYADDRYGLIYLLERSSYYTTHPVIFLACHGKRGSLDIGQDTVRLVDLADDLPEGLLSGKTVYLGSCATAADAAAMQTLRERSGAEVICGYADPKGVDNLEASAFELLLMRELTTSKRGTTALRRLKDRPASKSLWKAMNFVTVPARI